MNNKILIGSIIAVVILILVSFTSVVGYRSVESNLKPSPLFSVRSSRAIDEDSKDCNCQDNSNDNIVKTEKLLTRIKVYIILILSRYRPNPEIAEEYQKILDIINSDGTGDIFCNVLMRIGIRIEKLGEKVQDYRIIYFVLGLTMIPIIILWNMYCDE